MTASTPQWVILFLLFYFSVAIVLFLYGMHAYLMAVLYRRSLAHSPKVKPAADPPHVTVQLPLYNERYVAKRLIDAVAAFEYPRDRLEIQILDDSTDETVEEVAQLVEAWRDRGIDMVQVRRDRRVGYKGGALREGLETAKGELIAVFDADFVPPPDFLTRTVGQCTHPRTGIVHTRVTHLNEEYSPLTRAQAAALDGHFVIEHAVRNRNGAYINFNGTAGIWRKQAILDAGNWQDDTITEDLDLSYRAQLAGWRFLYLTEVECPAELPAEVNGLKGQQFRWAKGSVQTGLKILPRLLRSRASAFAKFQGCVHLTNHFVYPLLVVLGICFLPALMVLDRYPETGLLFKAATVLVVASFGHPWLYFLARRARGHSWRAAFAVLPLVVAGNMGIAINNSKAVFEALLRRPSGFNRTPKYALLARSGHWKNKGYRVRLSGWTLAELALAAYALASCVYAVRHGHYLAVPFLLLYVAGCGYIGLGSVASAWSAFTEARSRRQAPRPVGRPLTSTD